MATKPTKTTTVEDSASITKLAGLTGAAKDETVSVSVLTGSGDLNVLSNDPGSAVIYSLAQTVFNPATRTTTFNGTTLAATDQFPVITTGDIYSAGGAKLSLNSNGTIHYDASSMLSALQALAEGETFVDSFVYTIRMANGTISTAKATENVAGVNDAPVAKAKNDTATEDGNVIVGNVTATDVDHNAVLTFAAAASQSPVAGLTFNADGSYSFDPSNAAYQHLAAGATQDVVFNYTVTDEHNATSSSSLTITVTGTNDLPVAEAATGVATEDGEVVNGNVTATDVDDNAVLTFAAADGQSAVAGLTFNSDGSYSFDPSNAAYQHLAAGATENLVFNYTVTDEHNAASSSSLTITVTGTNDLPVAEAAIGVATEDGEVVNGNVTATDVDDNAVLTFAAADGQSAVAGLTFNADGSYSFDPSNAAYQHLAAGATEDVVFNYTVTDEHDASSSSNLTITVTGINDPAIISASGTQDTSVTESGTNVTGDNLAGGTLQVSDVDDNEAGFQVITGDGLKGQYGLFTFDAEEGDWTYTLDQSLAGGLVTGQSVSEVLTVHSLDGTSYDIIVNIAGSDDTNTNTSGGSVPAKGDTIDVTYGAGVVKLNNVSSDTLTAFGADDFLRLAGNIDYISAEIKDLDNDHQADDTLIHFKNVNKDFEVKLIGFTDFSNHQLLAPNGDPLY